MTLREGLQEYYRVNPGLSEPNQIKDPKSAAYFHNHDCTHVIFGTHTDVLNETINDLWTIFGVQIGFWDYGAGFFATDESKEISKSAFTPRSLLEATRGLKLTGMVRRHARAMTKKWPWTPTPEMLDRRLVDLRNEYGIDVFDVHLAMR